MNGRSRLQDPSKQAASPEKPPLPTGPAAQTVPEVKPQGPGKTIELTADPSGAKILGFDTGFPGWVVIPLFVLVWCGLTYLFAKAIFKYFKHLALLTGQKTYQLALASLQLPLVVLFLLLGFKVVIDSSPPEFQPYGNFTLTTLVVITLIMALARICTAILFELGTTKASFRPLVGPMRFVINVFVISVGAILWMEAVHIPVTPVVAAFGVVGLAAGLALWETLSNLFAGMYIILDRRLRVGDYIKVQGGEEGFVESIGWRSIRLVTTQNDLVMIPNRRMADSIVTNCSLPQTTSIALIEVQVDASVDVDRVIQILQEEVKGAVKSLAGAVPEQIPLVRFSAMTPQQLTFQVAVGIQNVLDRMNVQSELRKLTLNCLRRHSVPPWRTSTEAAHANGDGEEAKDRKKKKV